MQIIDDVFDTSYEDTSPEVYKKSFMSNVKFNVLFDETISKYVSVGRQLQERKDLASRYASIFCYIVVYKILQRYYHNTDVYIKNLKLFYSGEFWDYIDSGQLISCHTNTNLHIFDSNGKFSAYYMDGVYNISLDNMLTFLYSTGNDNSVNILAKMYILWELQHVINSDNISTKYTMYDYTMLANKLLDAEIDQLTALDINARLMLLVDNYIVTNNLNYTDLLESVIAKRNESVRKNLTCKALRLSICYDNDSNVTATYSYTDVFHDIHMVDVITKFEYDPQNPSTFIAKLSDRYKFILKVYEHSIHLYNVDLNQCYEGCTNCKGMVTYIEVKTLKSDVKVYYHDIPQELCNSLVNHTCVELGTSTSSNTLLLRSDINTQYKVCSTELTAQDPIWYLFH